MIVLKRDDELDSLRARVQALEGMREDLSVLPCCKFWMTEPHPDDRVEIAPGDHHARWCPRAILSRWPVPSAPDDRSSLQARVAELEGKLKKEEAASERLIRERDHFQERVDRLADELGVEEEWTNVTDRGQEAEYAANALVSRLAKLDALLASEEPPEGLLRAIWAEGAIPGVKPGKLADSPAYAAWRWFRETLQAQGREAERPAEPEAADPDGSCDCRPIPCGFPHTWEGDWCYVHQKPTPCPECPPAQPQEERWLVVICREGITEATPFESRADAVAFFDMVSLQWSDSYLTRVDRGPRDGWAIAATKPTAEPQEAGEGGER